MGKSLVLQADVQQEADIALDVRDILENLSSGDFENAKLIYENGRNSQLSEEDGNASQKRSLQSLSLEPVRAGGLSYMTYVRSDPTFAVQMYGLANMVQDTQDVILPVNSIQPYVTYGDTLISQMLLNTSSGTLAAEAMVSLNLWSHTIHTL